MQLCIYWVLLGGFDAINTFNQRTICSCMIFQPSWFILYFFFFRNSIVFYEIFYNDVTASRDVTYLFTDPDEICTAYVKLNYKHILFLRKFEKISIFDLFFEIITIIVFIYIYIYIYLYIYIYIYSFHIQGVTEIRVQNWTMPIKTKNMTFYKNDEKRLTA